MSRGARAVFASPIGEIGIGVSRGGLARVILGRAGERRVAERLAHEGFDSSSRNVARSANAIAKRMAAHLSGHMDDFLDIPIDYANTPPFFVDVFEALRRVAAGETVAYAELARRAGRPQAARAVGSAMRRNRVPIVVPCHRVVPSDRSLGSFSAGDGPPTKAKLLSIEGATTGAGAREPRERRAPSAVRALARKDALMRRCAHRWGSPEFVGREPADLLESACHAVVGQQLAPSAARSIWGRVLDAQPGRRLEAKRIVEAGETPLRRAGLSGAKARAVLGLADARLRGRLGRRRTGEPISDESLEQALLRVPGVGPWTVQMVLIFGLGRLDIWPVGDYGMRRGLARVLGTDEVPSARDCERLGDAWRPYRSIASYYLWRIAEADDSVWETLK